ncbi:MAG: IclR family transcriptional regulator [Chloroflexi bacterium]|nr:IclR family transcriptional regulator [Chloroflexota bacterium]
MQDTVSHHRTGAQRETRAPGTVARRDPTVQAIVHAFEVLDAFQGSSSYSVTELARQLRMHKSTAHRLLATLQRVGYVVQDEVTQRYHLGLKVLDLAASVSSTVDLRTRATPALQRLVATAQETVHLGVLIDGEVVCIESVPSARPIAVMRLVGKRGPAHVSSMGKVILAHQPDGVVEQVVTAKGLRRLTVHTIVDPVAFREHLKRVRAQGWAINAEEEELGFGCVAAPIWNHRGEVIAALSIAAPMGRLAGASRDRLVQLAVAGGQEISESLGFRPITNVSSNGRS